jgi:hypothetical protein
VVSVALLMPMMAISGRCRFGGFSAAIVASRSSCAIAGGVVTEAPAGSDQIQARAAFDENYDSAKGAPQQTSHFMVS